MKPFTRAGYWQESAPFCVGRRAKLLGRILHFGEAELDTRLRVIRHLGDDLNVTPAEYNLLMLFLQNPDRPLTREMIQNSVFDSECPRNTRLLDAHIVKLRQKLNVSRPSPRNVSPFTASGIDSCPEPLQEIHISLTDGR